MVSIEKRNGPGQAAGAVAYLRRDKVTMGANCTWPPVSVHVSWMALVLPALSSASSVRSGHASGCTASHALLVRMSWVSFSRCVSWVSVGALGRGGGVAPAGCGVTVDGRCSGVSSTILKLKRRSIDPVAVLLALGRLTLPCPAALAALDPEGPPCCSRMSISSACSTSSSDLT